MHLARQHPPLVVAHPLDRVEQRAQFLLRLALAQQLAFAPDGVAPQPYQANIRLDARHQVLGAEGLDHDIVRALVQGRDAGRFVGLAGQHDDLDRAEQFVSPHHAQQRDAVEIRHDLVDQDHIGLDPRRQRESLAPALRHLNGESGPLQDAPDVGYPQRLVVDKQHPDCRGCGLRNRPGRATPLFVQVAVISGHP